LWFVVCGLWFGVWCLVFGVACIKCNEIISNIHNPAYFKMDFQPFVRVENVQPLQPHKPHKPHKLQKPLKLFITFKLFLINQYPIDFRIKY